MAGSYMKHEGLDTSTFELMDSLATLVTSVEEHEVEAIENTYAKRLQRLKNYYEEVNKAIDQQYAREIEREAALTDIRKKYLAEHTKDYEELAKLEAEIQEKGILKLQDKHQQELQKLRDNLKKAEDKEAKKKAKEDLKAAEAKAKEELDRYEKTLKAKRKLQRKIDVKSGTTAKQVGDQIKQDVNALSITKNGRGIAGVFSNFGSIYRNAASGAVDDFGVHGKMTGVSRVIGAAANAMGEAAKALTTQVDQIASLKGAIDTRLQGSNINNKFMGSYWQNIQQDMIKVAAVSPFVKQEAIVKNIQDMVDKGIAFNVEQRAFLATIKDKIATTFNATDATLLKLIRLQQADSTAARLGMESAMTTFLNSMYENTEYLKGVAESVRSSLSEAMSFMSATASVGFEYQVQKWMGSLYSVGMSNEAVQGIAGALGKIAAGDISALTEGSGYGNLMVMAANKANLSIAEMLADGLNDSDTNLLLQAVVDYLGEIADQTADSRVVRQQMAKVFGVKGSDIIAASNLISSRSAIYNNGLNYNTAMNQLYNMSSTVYKRTSIGEMIQNTMDNAKYSMSSDIASNPVLYSLLKVGNLLEEVTGTGIAIPAFSVMGNMIDLETTVSNLMRAGALGGAAIGTMAKAISGLSNGLGPSGMLRTLGIEKGNITTLTRGNANSMTLTSGETTSESMYVGNTNSNDVQESTISNEMDKQQDKFAEAKAENEDKTLNDVDTTLWAIHALLEGVIENGVVRVNVDNIDKLGDNLTNTIANGRGY